MLIFGLGSVSSNETTMKLLITYDTPGFVPMHWFSKRICHTGNKRTASSSSTLSSQKLLYKAFNWETHQVLLFIFEINLFTLRKTGNWEILLIIHLKALDHCFCGLKQ